MKARIGTGQVLVKKLLIVLGYGAAGFGTRKPWSGKRQKEETSVTIMRLLMKEVESDKIDSFSHYLRPFLASQFQK